MNKKPLSNVDSIVYLGLPIQKNLGSDEYFKSKFIKMQQAYYSLKSLGCHDESISPKIFSIFYKSFCQSKIHYGMEMLHISQKKLNEYDSLQGKLIKYKFGLNKYARHTQLLESMRIRKIELVYARAKIIFAEQIKKSTLTAKLFNYLYCRDANNLNKKSYVAQIRALELKYNIDQAVSKKHAFDILNSQMRVIIDERGIELLKIIKQINRCIALDNTGNIKDLLSEIRYNTQYQDEHQRTTHQNRVRKEQVEKERNDARQNYELNEGWR